MLQSILDNKKAFSVFFAVIITGTVAFVVVLALAVISISSSRISNNFSYSLKAKSMANACAMEALINIRNDENFLGEHELIEGDYSCNYIINDLGSSEREILVWSEVSGVTKKIKIKTAIAFPKMNLEYWEEVADFN